MTLYLFPVALVLVAFSGCDVRYRSEKQACRSGSAAQCLVVARFYAGKTDGFVATMLSHATTAKQYFALGCKLGNSASCAQFGHMVVVGSYNAIRGGDFARADGITALGTACAAGDADACRELVDADASAQAAPGLSKLCNAGKKASCDVLVKAYFQTDPKRAVELLTKLCQAGDDEACSKLGLALLAGSDSVAADPSRGAELLSLACGRGGWQACRELGEAYLANQLPADPVRTAKLLGQACDHADADACFELGRVQLASDATKAVQTFNTACERGDNRGCDVLGDLYRVGTADIPRDSGRAESFYERACRTGDDFDCYKRRCMHGESDACDKVRSMQRSRRFRLGEPFDMK